MTHGRYCNGCGEFVTFPDETTRKKRRSRCPACYRASEQAKNQRRRERHGTTAQRGYGHRWQQLSALAIRRQPFCGNCGTDRDLTADHVIPRSKGGRNTLDNVRVLCRKCNASKKDRG